MSQFAAAEAGIRKLHAHYADAVFRKDFEAFAQCFAEDGEWRIAGNVLRGREQIATAAEGFLGRSRHIFMTFREPLIVREGKDKAHGRTYVSEQCCWLDGKTNLTLGRYYEHFVDTGEGWLFSWRLYQVLYTGPDDLTGDWFEEPDFGPPPGMPPRDFLPPPPRRKP